MKMKLLQKLLCAACLTGLLFACSDDDKFNGPSPDEVNATYTNYLSAGANANLSLLYNGEALIGKNVYFKLKDSNTGYLSLKQILPGELETNIDNVALTSNGDSYSFNGSTTTSTGISVSYAGSVEPGSLTLSLSNINMPDNLLKGKSFPLVKYGSTGAKYYNNLYTYVYTTPLMLRITLKAPLTGDYATLGTLLPLMGLMIPGMTGPAINLVLNDIQFGTDGNITANYAGWPEGLGFMDAASYTPRTDDEYTTSPINLATYYFTDDETMYVIPNIDQIIYVAQQASATKSNRSILDDANLQEFISELYNTLASWARSGVRFKAIQNPYTGDGYAPLCTFNSSGEKEISGYEQYTGDILLQIDTDQLAIVGPLLEILPVLAPDLCATQLSDIDALADYISIFQMLLPSVNTVGDLLTALREIGDNLDFEIGLLLTNPTN